MGSKQQPIRFLHERLEAAFAGQSVEQQLAVHHAAYETEDPHRAVNTNLAMLNTFISCGAFRGTQDLPVARYVVADALYQAMLETEPPRGLDDCDLMLPEGAILVRWPNGEETYAATYQRFVLWTVEYFPPTAVEKWSRMPVWMDMQRPDLVLWHQFATGTGSRRKVFEQMAQRGRRPSPRDDGFYYESWYGSLDGDAPAFSTPSEMEEVEARRALLQTLLVYLTTGEKVDAVRTDFQKPPKKKGKKERPPRWLNYVHLGSRTRYLSHEEVAERERRAGRKLDHRVRVRGHYRSQAHGPKHSLRKWIWIAPHYRGTDGAFIDRVIRLDL